MVRDPISILKAFLNTGFTKEDKKDKNAICNKKIFDLTCDPKIILESRQSFGFVLSNIQEPTTDEIPFVMNFFSFLFHDSQIIKQLINIKKIQIMPMSDISPENAFDTFTKLSLKYGFNAPKEHHKELFKQRVSSLEIGLPIHIYAHKNDIGRFSTDSFINDFGDQKLKGGFIITINHIFETNSSYENITKEIYGEEDITPLCILARDDEYEKICQNRADFELLKPVLRRYFDYFKEVIAQKIKSNSAKSLSENDILHYFKNNPFFAKKFRDIAEAHLEYLRINRPELIDDFTYYNEFLKMCEGIK